MHILYGLIVGLVAGAVVAVVGSLFDPTVDNRYSRVAGLLVFVVAFLAYAGIAGF